jgi:adenylate cyclase, class 2
MELEVKYQLADWGGTYERIQAQGFVLAKQSEQTDTYFLVNVAADDGAKHYLRIREDRTARTNSLDYHRAWSSGASEETEVGIEDRPATVKILMFLGLTVQCVVAKTRKEFRRDGVLVVMDDVEDLGHFVEIEIEGELTPENLSILDRIGREIGLERASEIRNAGYPDLIMARTRGIRPSS